MRVHIFVRASLLLVVALCAVTRGSRVVEQQQDERHSEYSSITDFTRRVIHWLKTHGRGAGKQCFAKKKAGRVPSAASLDSPLKTFGYPDFNVKLREAIVRAGIPLSFLGGYRQPIKIGSQDYVVAGYADELLAFFACFEKYSVIGSTLNAAGHWIHDTGAVKIQVSNLNTFSRLSSSVFEMVFKYTLDRIIKYLDPVKVIEAKDCQIFGGCDVASSREKLRRAYEKIKKWLPFSENVIKKVVEIYSKKLPIQQKAKELLEFIRAEEKRKAGIRARWLGWGNVSYGKKMLVTLTMYSKPENRVRSTYIMKGATVTMGDVGEALKLALDRK